MRCCAAPQLFILIALICPRVSSFSQKPPNLELLFSRLKHYDSLPSKTYADDSIAVGVIGRLCWEYRLINKDSAMYYGNEAMQIAQRANYKKGIGLICTQMAAVYRLQGDFINALNYHSKALDVWLSFKNSNPNYYYSSIILDEARTYNNMGIIYDQLGENTKAMELYLKALAIDESKNNEIGMANKLGNIGTLFLKQSDYDKALSYYLKTLDIAEKKDEKTILSECYGHIGFAYWKKQNRDSAMNYYQKALKMNESVGNKKLLSDNLSDMSLIYEEEKNYATALEYANKSIELKKDIDDRSGIAATYGNIGSMYLNLNQLPEAEKYLITAKNMADSLSEKSLQLDQYMHLCSLYTKKEQYHEALIYEQKATAFKDSLFNQQKTQELTSKELNYEFDKKTAASKAEYEKQIAIAEANKKLAIAESEKKTIQAETEKKLGIANAETKRVAAEAETEKTILESNKRIAITEAGRKRNQAEADKKIAVSNAALEKQTLMRNAIAAGAGILILSSFISFFFYKRKRDADQKQKETYLNLQAAENEMKALRSQMNPHFIFNALGSIQSFLLNNQPADADKYLLKFKELIRLVLENSRQQQVALAEDMKAMELYMQLENIRMNNPFSYHFQIDNNINTEQAEIPALILQPFIENAIWHGLQCKKEAGGRISILVNKQDDNLVCIVEDNGVGRSSEKNKTNSPFKKESLGIKLTEERLKILNAIKKVNAYFKITDLFTNDNKPCGTRVKLVLPFSA